MTATFTLADLAPHRGASAPRLRRPKSYTAKLSPTGRRARAKKLGEEAVEAVIAAVAGRPAS